MRLRKEVYLVLAVILILALFIIFRPKTKSDLDSTNLDGIEINTDTADSYIKFADNDRVGLSNPAPMFLIVNGSVIKNPDIKAIDGSAMIPAEKFAEIVGAKLVVSEKNGDEFNLKADKKKGLPGVTFRLNDGSYEINAKSEFMAGKPVRDGRTVYLPVKSFFEAYGYTVTYTNGKKVKVDEFPVIPLYQQLMVYKYDTNKKALTKEEAIKKVQEELKVAYKANFNKKYKAPDDSIDRMNPSREDEWRIKINDGLEVKAENDRYYVIPVVYDFYVDKYTGEIYSFYQGQTFVYKKFDPKAPGSLAFPG